LVISALGLGLAIAALGAALSVSWVLIPLLVPLVGVPLLIGGGVLAGLFAIPALIQLGVIAAGLGVGAWVARTLVFGNGEVEQAASDTIVDVEVETVENWVSDLDKDAKQREKELREFDEMLKQRDRFRSKY
jgi:hypothetical protein